MTPEPRGSTSNRAAQTSPSLSLLRQRFTVALWSRRLPQCYPLISSVALGVLHTLVGPNALLDLHLIQANDLADPGHEAFFQKPYLHQRADNPNFLAAQ